MIVVKMDIEAITKTLSDKTTTLYLDLGHNHVDVELQKQQSSEKRDKRRKRQSDRRLWKRLHEHSIEILVQKLQNEVYEDEDVDYDMHFYDSGSEKLLHLIVSIHPLEESKERIKKIKNGHLFGPQLQMFRLSDVEIIVRLMISLNPSEEDEEDAEQDAELKIKKDVNKQELAEIKKQELAAVLEKHLFVCFDCFDDNNGNNASYAWSCHQTFSSEEDKGVHERIQRCQKFMEKVFRDLFKWTRLSAFHCVQVVE